MSRRIFSRGVCAALVAAAGGVVSIASIARAQSVPDYVTIVPGSLTQGTVKASLGSGTTYDTTSANLGDWPLNTGNNVPGGSGYAISYENPHYNANAFGGNANTMIAFGNGGGVTLQFQTPITPISGEKDLGIVTAQAITGGSYALNGNMEATILVSSDGVNWYTLVGAKVASSYLGALGDGTTYSLDAPTMAYNFLAGKNAWTYDNAKLPAGGFTTANYTTPMPNDNLFNGTGTNAQRSALTADTSTSDYAAIFGATGGGNWFEVDDSGLSSIDYVRLNGDSDDPSTGGVRLEDVFANSNAVPEPTTLSLLTVGAAALLKRRRRKM